MILLYHTNYNNDVGYRRANYFVTITKLFSVCLSKPDADLINIISYLRWQIEDKNAMIIAIAMKRTMIIAAMFVILIIKPKLPTN